MSFSRRKIIKSLGLLAGASATGWIPGMSLFARQNSDILKSGLEAAPGCTKAVLIGAGKRGWRFGKFSQKYPELLRIMAIGEPLRERRIQAAELLGLSAETCFAYGEDLPGRKTDADVAIITAAGNYPEICTRALVAGYHVWVDRPVSMEQDEIIAINKTAAACNRQLRFCYIHEGQLNFMDHRVFEKNKADA